VKEYLPKMLNFVIDDVAFRKSNLCTSSLRILCTVKRALVMYPPHIHTMHVSWRDKNFK
jgi:hypothetical protein